MPERNPKNTNEELINAIRNMAIKQNEEGEGFKRSGMKGLSEKAFGMVQILIDLITDLRLDHMDKHKDNPD